jgi:hypothetical protein
MRSTLIVVLLFPFLNGSSCTTTDQSTRDPDGGYDYGYDDDRYGLPDNAARVVEGKGQRLNFTPNRTGDYFVYYSKDRQIIKSGRLYDGDKLVVDPDKNRIYVEGKTVYDSDLKSDRTYRIYFSRADGRSYNGPPGWVGDSSDRPGARPPSTGVKIAKDAVLVTQGRGKLEMIPKFDGDYWVQDANNAATVANGRIDKGQKLLVQPEADHKQVTLDSRTVLDRGLKRDSAHKIFFLRR